MRFPEFRWTTLAAIALLPLAACSSSDSNGKGGQTIPAADYVGTFGSGGGSGSIAINVPEHPAPVSSKPDIASPSLSLGPVNISATLQVTGGGTVSLNGTLSAAIIQLSGSNYTFQGSLSNGTISGTFTAPGGQTGTFNAVLTTNSNTARVFCGTYQGVDANDAPESGVFNLVLNGDGDGGVVTVDDASGSVSGFSARTGTGGSIEVYDPSFPTFNIVSDGSIVGAKIDGTYDTGSSSGTFHGGTDECN